MAGLPPFLENVLFYVNLKYVSGVHHDVLAMLSFMECGIKLLNVYIATYFSVPYIEGSGGQERLRMLPEVTRL